MRSFQSNARRRAATSHYGFANLFLALIVLSFCSSSINAGTLRRRRMSETKSLDDLRTTRGSSSNSRRDNSENNITTTPSTKQIIAPAVQKEDDDLVSGVMESKKNWCSENISLFHPWSFEDNDGNIKPLFHMEVELSGVSRHREKKLIQEVRSALLASFSKYVHRMFNNNNVDATNHSNSNSTVEIKSVDFEAGLGLPVYSFQIWDKTLTLFFQPPAFRGIIYYSCSDERQEQQQQQHTVEKVTNTLRSSMSVIETYLQEELSLNEELPITWNIENVSLREHDVITEVAET